MSSIGPIDHLGLLVENIEEAKIHWAAATGYFFSPIGRYPSKHYRDTSSWEIHENDPRISFSYEGAPSIELMQFAGDGSHSAALGEGAHHLAFKGFEDNIAWRDELAGRGFPAGAESYDAAGNLLLWFTDRGVLNDIHLEFVQEGDHPSTLDDYSPMNILDDGGDSYFTAEQDREHRALPPGGPLIAEFGVVVIDLDTAVERWSDITGFTFEPVTDTSDVVTTRSFRGGEGPATIRLIEAAESGPLAASLGEGVKYLRFVDADLAGRRAILEAAGLTVVASTDADGGPTEFLTDTTGLANIRLLITAA